MVTLRVDVEAARARTEFASASRSVDGFRDQVRNAERAANGFERELQNTQTRLGGLDASLHQAQRASEDAAIEVRRLNQQVEQLGGAAPEALVRQLHQAQRAAEQTRREEERIAIAAAAARDEVHRLTGQFDAASDQAAQMRTRLTESVVAAEALRHALRQAEQNTGGVSNSAQRGLLGLRQQLNQLVSPSAPTGAIGQAWAAMPVELKAVVASAGVAMAVIFASALGAAINGLLLTAVGAGVIAGMAAIAAKSSNVVQHAFADVFRPIKQDALDFAAVAEGPLVHAALTLGAAWSDVRDDVRGAFTDVAPEISDLADGLGGLVRNVMPGLRAALSASLPVLKELANDLPMLGSAISKMFEEMSTDGEGAAKGLRFLFELLGGTLVAIGKVIGFLTHEFDVLTAGGERVFGALAKIPGLGKLFQPLAGLFQEINNTTEQTSRSLDGTGEAADRTALGMGRVADATQRASRAVYDLSQKMSDLMGQELSLSDANLAFNKSLLDVTASFKENGKTLDAHTEKGIANLQIVNASIEAARTARDRAIDLAGGQNASAAAVEAANAAYNAQVAQLEAVLRKAGLTKQQIDDLLGAYRNIASAPNIEKTINVTYRTSGANTVATSTYALPGGGTRTSSHAFNRFGGLWARQGLINLDGMAGMFSAGSPLFGFAEPQTGGEAFIARNAPRARSLAIAAAAARWHGASLVPDEATRAAGGGGGVVRVDAELVPTSSGMGWIADLINSAVKAGAVRLVVRQAGGRVGVVTVA